jgi:hypothetical protein
MYRPSLLTFFLRNITSALFISDPEMWQNFRKVFIQLIDKVLSLAVKT